MSDVEEEEEVVVVVVSVLLLLLFVHYIYVWSDCKSLQKRRKS